MRLKSRFWLVVMLAIAFLPVFAQEREVSPKAVERIQKEVRHELVMLPYLDVFDNLAYKVDGYTVSLFGQVTNPTVKSDAERAVKKIEGVEKVDNQIEVLPVSPMDDGLRRRLFRAIYGYAPLKSMLCRRSNPSALSSRTAMSPWKEWWTAKGTRTSSTSAPTASRAYSR
jgi:hypothetical protein